MALNKLKFNSLNVTPAASEAIRFNSSANGLETTSSFGGNLKNYLQQLYQVQHLQFHSHQESIALIKNTFLSLIICTQKQINKVLE